MTSITFTFSPKKKMGFYKKRSKYEWQRQWKVFVRVDKIITDKNEELFILTSPSTNLYIGMVSKKSLREDYIKSSKKEYQDYNIMFICKRNEAKN